MVQLQVQFARRAIAVLALVLLAWPGLPARAQGTKLSETGSTLIYPLFQLWIADYAKVAPDVTLTATGTGSAMGIAAAVNKEAEIGASDAYMSDEQAEQNPEIVDIPVAISAQTVNYNIPDLNDAGLKLDGRVLARIYRGRITEWDAAPIVALNPGVKLPHQPIVPLRRADGSGDTFIFTQFLDFADQDWEDRLGYGMTLKWPDVAGERAVTGNEGMVTALVKTPYSVGYVGVSFHQAMAKAKLGTARLANQAGKFLLPTPETIQAAASELDSRTPPDERLSLVYAPGDDSYPLINYEYVVVSTRQADPKTAAALRHFLLWAVSLEGGNAGTYLDRVGFVPLPDFIRAISEQQIGRIQ